MRCRLFSLWRNVSLAALCLYVCGSIYIFSPPLRTSTTGARADNGAHKDSNAQYSTFKQQPQNTVVPQPARPMAPETLQRVVDSIVFVALGPAARSTSLLYALRSLKEEGEWRGPVHVIVGATEDLGCLMSHLPDADNINIVETSAETSTVAMGKGGDGSSTIIAHAKMAKMHLLDLLPEALRRVVYIDVDVITQQPIAPFIGMVERRWAELDRADAAAAAKKKAANELRAYTHRLGEKTAATATKRRDGQISPPSTLLIFPDAWGHTVPVCPGCDLAHSGVVGIERGRSELCLKLWLEAFAGDDKSGREGTSTDQEALDYAIRKGSGCEATWLDASHLRFMKDISVLFGLSRTRTFGHFTSLLHPERLNWLFRRHYSKSLRRGFDEWGGKRGVIERCALEIEHRHAENAEANDRVSRRLRHH